MIFYNEIALHYDASLRDILVFKVAKISLHFHS